MSKLSKGQISYERVDELERRLHSMSTNIFANWKFVSQSINITDNPVVLFEADALKGGTIVVHFFNSTEGQIMLYDGSICVAVIDSKSSMLISYKTSSDKVKLAAFSNAPLSGNVSLSISGGINVPQSRSVICDINDTCYIVDYIRGGYSKCSVDSLPYRIDGTFTPCGKIISYGTNGDNFFVLCKDDKTTKVVGENVDSIVVGSDAISLAIGSDEYAILSHSGISITTLADGTSRTISANLKDILRAYPLVSENYKFAFICQTFSGRCMRVTIDSNDNIKSTLLPKIMCSEMYLVISSEEYLSVVDGTSEYIYRVSDNDLVYAFRFPRNCNFGVCQGACVSVVGDYISRILE